MKHILICLAITTAMAAHARAQATLGGQPVTTEVLVDIDDAIVPSEVDKSSEAYVAISGQFPNSCYKYDRAHVATVQQMVHEVRSVAGVVANLECLMVIVPYTHEVSLGHLPSGVHLIRFVNPDGSYFERQLVVR